MNDDVPVEYREEHDENGVRWGASWLLRQQSAHPVWSEYLIVLYDLDAPVPGMAAKHFEEATHEAMLFAVDPGDEHDWTSAVWHGWPGRIEPALHCFQFRSRSAEEARDRICTLVTLILNETISPTRRHEELWDALFADGVSNRRSMVATVQNDAPWETPGTHD